MKVVRVGLVGAAWACAALAVAAFMMPWVHLDVHEPGLLKHIRQAAPLQDTLSRIAVKIKRGAETVTGEIPLSSLSDIPQEISGKDIPVLANSDRTQLAMFVMQMLTGKPQDYGGQSYAVYLLPGLAALAALLLTVLGRQRVVALGIAVLCALIAGAGYWKLSTVSANTLVSTVRIGAGLWLSLGAYAGLAAAAAGCSLLSVKKS